MSKITMTPDLAWACSFDAGNRSMRKAGRKAWNEEDRQAAHDELYRLMPPNPELEAAIAKATGK